MQLVSLSQPRRRAALIVVVIGAMFAMTALLAGPAAPGASAATSPLFLVTPTALDFGDVGVGSTSAQQIITITNVSGSPILMSGAGGGAGVFGGSQDCQGLTIAAGASCHMYYQFTPTALGAVTGGTSVNWNGQTFAFTFNGTGVNPFLITATSFDFGDVPVGTTSAQQLVTITNVTDSPIVMSGAGGGAGVFGGSQDCQGLTIAAGASCHMYYQFTPTAPGAVTGSTSGNWNGQTFSFTFTGTGAGTVTTAPVVTGISPSAGPVSGGTPVVVKGTGFTGATAVAFGTLSASSFTVVSDTEIHAVSPAQTHAGPKDVVVTTPGGNSATGAADVFTYKYRPIVFKVLPSSGPTSGGTHVTLKGVGFSGATSVLFGTVPASSFTVVSDHTITAVSPAHSLATVDVHVVTAGGTSPSIAADRFTYHVRHPAITGLSPTSGPTSGGTHVIVTGSGFAGATTVLFGSVHASSFVVLSDTKIFVVSPAQTVGLHNVHVVTPGGTSPSVPADLFHYH
jgi:hypothetical protein